MSQRRKPPADIETDDDWERDWFDESEDSTGRRNEGRATRGATQRKAEARRALERMLEEMALQKELDEYDDYELDEYDDYDGYLH